MSPRRVEGRRLAAHTEVMNVRMQSFGLGVTLVASILLVGSASLAEETVCDGSLGDVAVDNLRVPDGERCSLAGTRIAGTLQVGTGASLAAKDIAVVGNVQAEGAAKLRLKNSTVGGSVQHVQGGRALVKGTRIEGDILFDSNDGKLAAFRNEIGGNLQAFQNEGGVKIASNVIDGNLQCKENVPAPRGRKNVVGGNAEDQCARFVGDTVIPPPDLGEDGGSCSFGAVTLGDDFEIPAGVKCKMNGTRVAGSIKLNDGSGLFAKSIVVDGNIQGQHAFGVAVADSLVKGSVQLDAGGFATVVRSRIHGNIQFVSNDGKLLVHDNRVNQDVQLFENRGGPFTITDNTIDGNLQCKQNDPAPGGGGNVVGGNKEDQCSGL
jgi:hypothetical protein